MNQGDSQTETDGGNNDSAAPCRALCGLRAHVRARVICFTELHAAIYYSKLKVIFLTYKPSLPLHPCFFPPPYPNLSCSKENDDLGMGQDLLVPEGIKGHKHLSKQGNFSGERLKLLWLRWLRVPKSCSNPICREKRCQDSAGGACSKWRRKVYNILRVPTVAQQKQT